MMLADMGKDQPYLTSFLLCLQVWDAQSKSRLLSAGALIDGC